MKLTCPGCAATGSIELFTADVDARHCVQLAAQLPPALAGLIFPYLSLFRTGTRGVQWLRVRKLLEELMPMITSGQVQRHGRPWAAPLESWRQGFEAMIAQRDKLTLPLKSHGYLLEIVCGVANKSEAISEAQREEQRHRRLRDAADVIADSVIGREHNNSSVREASLSQTLQRTWIASENAIRARTGLAPMDASEEREYLQKMGGQK